MGKKGKKAKKPPAAASAVSPTASADAPADIEAEADPVVPAPAEDSSNDSGDDASGTTEGDEPREEAPIQPRPPAVEDAEAPTERSEPSGASEHLAMELASLRARCVSLEEEADAASSAHAEALRSLRAEKDALARSHLAELARARAVADADASSAKTELASMRAMSSAQRAKIDALGETVSALETTLERLERERDATRAAATAEAVALALAAADARHADALRAAVRSEREALRRAYVVHAAAKRAWAAEKIGLVEARGDAFEREAEEAARVARLARAAVGTPRGPDDDRSRSLFKSLTEDDEKEALLSPGAALRALFAATTPSRSRAALDAARADAASESTFDSNTERTSAIGGAKKTSGETRSDVRESESSESESSSESSSSDGSDGRSATSPATGTARSNGSNANAIGGELADLLDDAMEDEISASVARGYCVDAETGAVVVGANAIVEKVMVKYRGDSLEAPRRNLSPLFSPRNAGDVGAILPEAVAHAAANQGPAFQAAVREANSVRSETPSGMRPSEAFALRVERERHRRERATLLAELQQSRAETQVARLEARSEHSRAEAVETMSLEYEKEEDVSVRRLELAAEVRARALEAALKTAREKAAPKAALRAVLAELGELKARLARVRDAQETSARLIAPTVASALACLKL